MRRIVRFFSLLVIIAAVGGWIWLIYDLPSPHNALEEGRLLGPTTRIYDRNGILLYEILPTALEAGKRAPVALAQIPLSLQQATLATEDAAFYEHPGVDWRGILRAVRRNWEEGQLAAGGSTITQQVARLLLEPEERQERSLRRKLREAILALQLEQAYTKDEILELYLNHAYYGNLSYGVEAAAQSYFGKHVWELSTAESAMLAGLPQAPALYNPLLDVESAHARQADVLRLMMENGYVNSEAIPTLQNEPLRFATEPFPIEAPHFVMWVIQEMERRFGAQLTDGTGLDVTTTLDINLQDIAQNSVTYHLAELQGRNDGTPDRHVNSAALVALDPLTGDVLAMVGSPDYFDATIAGAVNIALQPRQPGSALKPITYAAAFDPARTNNTPYSPATVLSDVQTTFIAGDGKYYAPENYDRTHRGPISLRDALATSNNVVAVKVLQKVGVAHMIELARAMGIRSLDDPQRYDLTVTLGGGEVTLLELTNAYATFAANGRQTPPRTILKVESHEGDLLWEAPIPTPKPVLDARIAALITDVLADPLARAPTFGEWNALRLPFPAAAKTGTTTDWRDNWTMGYTPDLAVGVWVGNADNTPMNQVSGVDGAGPIWNDFMRRALRHSNRPDFETPQGMVRAEICTASGLLPSALCPSRKVEWFLEESVPTEQDHSYQLVRVDTESGLLAGSACESQVEEKLFRMPPPDAMAWAREQQWEFPPTRQCTGDVALAVAQSGEQVAISSPIAGTRYRLDPAIPLANQRIPIEVVTPAPFPIASGVLVVDGQPVAHFADLPTRQWWSLTPGTHAVQAILELPTGERIQSQAVSFVVE
jgi:1A family penicillin-binding protein